MPRRLYIKKADIEKHGMTEGCKGCVAMIRGDKGVAHSEACRKRITEEIGKAEGGQDRVKNARDRVKEFEERAIKMQKVEPEEKRDEEYV